MTAVTRETLMAALFAKLQTLSGYTVFTRRFVPRGELGIGSLPILMMIEDAEPEKIEQAGPAGQRRFVGVMVIVAARNTNKAVSGITLINPMVDAIDNLLTAPDNLANGRFTLGGLATYCRIEGQLFKQSGDIDADGIGGAVIPIKILMP